MTVVDGHSILHACLDTAAAVEEYVKRHLFDPHGIMYSGIDSHTDAPFDRDFITPQKVPRRAAFDPWSFWTYEDSVMSMGSYLDGLVLKYEVTGDSECLTRADRIWKVICEIYSCSQVHGIGSFLRPYGGFEQMHRFIEPLGTDQASPLFCGLYRYLAHADARDATDIRRVMLKTLEWYEQQGFQYFYYKSFIHRYTPGDPLANHPNSYYLPAIAWAADTFPNDEQWRRHLDERLGYFVSGQYPVYPRGSHQPTFCWGSDFAILKRILGPRFDPIFTGERLDEAFEAVTEVLATYREPGILKRACPESADPDFRPVVDPGFDPRKGLGFAYSHTRHHGRFRPKNEINFLIALAAVGYRKQETARWAAELLSLRAAVPRDFTHFLADDYDLLPETVHLYARSVGIIMVVWWRNYWFLRQLLQNKNPKPQLDAAADTDKPRR